jgi:cell division protein FtsB
VVALRQPKHASIAALLLDRGTGFLYGFATVIIAIGIFRGETSIGKYFALTKSQVVLEETVASLRTENEHLQDEITRIKESKAYARKVLREKYHVTDANEKIIYYAD